MDLFYRYTNQCGDVIEISWFHRFVPSEFRKSMMLEF